MSEEVTAVPVDTEVSPDIQKAVVEATGELFDKMMTAMPTMAKAFGGNWDENPGAQRAKEPKAWFNDPFQLLDSIGMGYRANPSQVTYETLRQMTERDTLLSAILLTRINQVASFCRPQENKYSIGFKIRPRGGEKNRRLTDSEKERTRRIEKFLLNMGVDNNIERDGFEQFMRKTVRDRLTYDQTTFEKTRTVGGSLHAIYAVPGDTIRIAHPRDAKGTPPDVAQVRRSIKYVQIVNGEIAAEFTPHELAFCVANPRTSMRVYGYGFPEPQMLINTVTSHIWAEEWNRKAFSQGSTIKGVLNMKGNVPTKMYEAFKRAFTAQVSGVHNAWRTPILNSDGIEFTPMQMSNTEMGYQMWIEYLVKVACAIYQMDPTEINFDLRGSSGQQPMFMSANESQQKVSKDRGLKPLLRFFEDMLNRHVVWCLDDEYEFAFVGLDAKTEEQAIELRMKEAQTYLTMDEVRAKEELPPVEEGQIIANPTYTGWLQNKAMQDQQGQMGGMPGMEGGEEGGPQEEYQGAFNQEPGEEEAAGQQKLQQAAEQKPKMDKDTQRVLRQNDWMSSVRQSVEDNDLRKSEDDEPIVYDVLDL